MQSASQIVCQSFLPIAIDPSNQLTALKLVFIVHYSGQKADVGSGAALAEREEF